MDISARFHVSMYSCFHNSMYLCFHASIQGQNIVLNMNDHGFVVCAYNRTVAKVEEFLANQALGKNASHYCPIFKF